MRLRIGDGRPGCGSSARAAPDGVRFLLGVDPDGVAYFGVAGPLPDCASPTKTASGPVPLREAGTLLSDRDAGLMTHAVALANWHETFTHCPRCGAPTEPSPPGTRANARPTAASTSRAWTPR